MKATFTQDSINANGNSFDVFQGPLAECISLAKEMFKENYNTHIDPYVRDLGVVNIDDSEYRLHESYIDSGSDDYFYFAVRN